MMKRARIGVTILAIAAISSTLVSCSTSGNRHSPVASALPDDTAPAARIPAAETIYAPRSTSMTDQLSSTQKCVNAEAACYQVRIDLDSLQGRATPDERRNVESRCKTEVGDACRRGESTPFDLVAEVEMDPRRGTSDDQIQIWLEAIFQPDFHATFEFIDRGYSEVQNVFTMLFERAYQDNRPAAGYTPEDRQRLKDSFYYFSQKQVDLAARAIRAIPSPAIRTLVLLTLTAVQWRNMGVNNDLITGGRSGTIPAIIKLKRFRNGTWVGVSPRRRGRQANFWVGYNRTF